ncbi:WD40 repeat [Dillenia turbinata]|uniref:WD40 repeat n=1 Tax=Dillenia turbinata TaxID=194707 RepID=A0AAN8Z825_9MAGN
MRSSNHQSFFNAIKSRELSGFRVRKRPLFGDTSNFNVFSSVGIEVEHNGELTPPMALSFCKLFLTRMDMFLYIIHERGFNLPCLMVKMQDDAQILTASGDQSIKAWDAQEKKCVGILLGHTGSVKSLCSHPTNPSLVVSGSRDGSFALWDLRCKSTSISGEVSSVPVAVVEKAHKPVGRPISRLKAASMSITSVLYLKDDISIASAGAVDGMLKFWDSRNLKALVTQTSPHSGSSNQKERRVHGISSLSQDSSGVFISASCMDNRIYLYHTLQLEKGPVASFSGCQINSFFVKSAISPDATLILSGSSDGDAYLWQVNKPELDPIRLNSHENEVTAVDWCPFEVGKIATASDDYTIRIWNVQSTSCSSTRSPSSIRRRVMAVPSMECRRLFADEESNDHTATEPEGIKSFFFQNLEAEQVKLTTTNTVLKIRTPESHEKQFSPGLELKESFLKTPQATLPGLGIKDGLQKTPEATLKSPSSVLSAPSSIKRTIRDYFVASS